MRSTRKPLATAGAFFAALLALATLPAQASAQYYLFESLAWPSKCMDNYRGLLTGGNSLQIYNCQSSVNQKFSLQADGHVIVQNGQTDGSGYQYCMDYYPTNGSVGSQVKIWPCRPLSGPGDSQHWYFLGSGQWMGGSGNCISAQAGANETKLVMAACNPSSPPLNTRWKTRQ
ncbi:MAG TPA: RICIN domain-containing protein [Longimicrobiaceae bacterium]|nr:RICIN domain-containing protein [Longimicrobiaceae bacterium]